MKIKFKALFTILTLLIFTFSSSIFNVMNVYADDMEVHYLTKIGEYVESINSSLKKYHEDYVVFNEVSGRYPRANVSGEINSRNADGSIVLWGDASFIDTPNDKISRELGEKYGEGNILVQNPDSKNVTSDSYLSTAHCYLGYTVSQNMFGQDVPVYIYGPAPSEFNTANNNLYTSNMNYINAKNSLLDYIHNYNAAEADNISLKNHTYDLINLIKNYKNDTILDQNEINEILQIINSLEHNLIYKKVVDAKILRAMSTVYDGQEEEEFRKLHYYTEIAKLDPKEFSKFGWNFNEKILIGRALLSLGNDSLGNKYLKEVLDNAQDNELVRRANNLLQFGYAGEYIARASELSAQEYRNDYDIIHICDKGIKDLITHKLTKGLYKLNYYKAKAYGNMGELSSAEKYFGKAIEIDPNNVDAYEDMTIILFNGNKWSEAKKYYKKAIKLDPSLKDADSFAYFEELFDGDIESENTEGYNMFNQDYSSDSVNKDCIVKIGKYEYVVGTDSVIDPLIDFRNSFGYSEASYLYENTTLYDFNDYDDNNNGSYTFWFNAGDSNNLIYSINYMKGSKSVPKEFEFSTGKGIKIGNTISDVIKVYGNVNTKQTFEAPSGNQGIELTYLFSVDGNNNIKLVFYGEAEKGKDVKTAKVSGIDVVLESK